MRKSKGQKKDLKLLFTAILFILVGAIIFAYPNISNYFAEKNHVEAIQTYQEIVSSYSKEKIDEEMRKSQGI